MEYLHNGFSLYIPHGAFPLSTDTMLLADFVKLPKNAEVLDLGSGCGSLGLLLCAKDDTCHITGLELDKGAHEAALENAEQNNLTDRLQSICVDLRQAAQLFPKGSFRCCVSNPPYFSGGPASKTLAVARRDDHCTAEDLFAAAAITLKYGGDFFLVHRPEQLAHLCACAAKCGLEPKRLRLVRHRSDGPVALILLQCRKGGKPGLKWEEICLFDRDGQPTADYNRIYHID